MTKPNLNLKPHQVFLAVFLKLVREEEEEDETPRSGNRHRLC